MPTLIDDALAYAERGWAVLPLHTPVAGRCTCGRDCGKKIGKHPRTAHGSQDAVRERATIQLWFSELWENANLGIATGGASNLFLLDVDPRNGGAESFEQILAQHGKFPDTVQHLSGGGGLGLWFQYPGWPIKNHKLAPGIDLRGEGGYFVAPHSLHASGRYYEFDSAAHPDMTRIAPAPDWLLETLYAKNHAPTADPSTFAPLAQPRGLPRLAWHILHGTSRRHYPTPSEAEQAAITALVNAGWAFEAVLDAFGRLAHPETHFRRAQREDGDHEARRWLKLSFDNAVKFVLSHDSAETRRVLHLAGERRNWALNVPWQGRGGASQFKVLLAHIAVVEMCKRDIYHADERTIADNANCARCTVHRAHKALMQRSVLRRVTPYDPRKPSLATQWQLLPVAPLLESVPLGYHSQGGESVREWYPNGTSQHDLFRGQSSAGQIFSLLLQGPRRAGELAHVSGRGRNTVWRGLQTLAALGLVERDGEFWRAREGVDLAALAAERGTNITAQRQRKRHADQRAARRAKFGK